MSRKITIMATLAGVVFGVAATEGINVYHQSHDCRIFQERLRCKAAADAYVKANGNDLKFVTLGKVDYSPARNSCVADVEETVWAHTPLVTEKVVDLLSGETLFSGRCAQDCLLLRPMFVDRAFDYVMNNASEPSELEKSWLSMESQIPTRSAPPSVTQWDAKGNPIPDAKHPPRSADHPSGR